MMVECFGITLDDSKKGNAGSAGTSAHEVPAVTTISLSDESLIGRQRSARGGVAAYGWFDTSPSNMKAILKVDFINKYKKSRPIEVPLTAEERREFVKTHDRGTQVPSTKWVTLPVYYGKAGDELEVFMENLNGFSIEEIEVLILIAKDGERFGIHRSLVTLKK